MMTNTNDASTAKFASIVFMQGDNADEAFAAAMAYVVAECGGPATTLYIGCREWTQGLFAHLAQWDQGEATQDDAFGEGQTLEAMGTASDVTMFTESGDMILSGTVTADEPAYYVLSYSYSYTYAGLSRIMATDGGAA